MCFFCCFFKFGPLVSKFALKYTGADFFCVGHITKRTVCECETGNSRALCSLALRMQPIRKQLKE